MIEGKAMSAVGLEVIEHTVHLTHAWEPLGWRARTDRCGAPPAILSEMPLLADHLEDSLSQLGRSWTKRQRAHL
jgi:hypothetical protein